MVEIAGIALAAFPPSFWLLSRATLQGNRLGSGFLVPTGVRRCRARDLPKNSTLSEPTTPPKIGSSEFRDIKGN